MKRYIYRPEHNKIEMFTDEKWEEYEKIKKILDDNADMFSRYNRELFSHWIQVEDPEQITNHPLETLNKIFHYTKGFILIHGATLAAWTYEELGDQFKITETFIYQAIQKESPVILLPYVGGHIVVNTEEISSPLTWKDGKLVVEDAFLNGSAESIQKAIDEDIAEKNAIKFAVHATMDDLLSLQKKLKEYEESAEQDEFVLLVRADTVLEKAIDAMQKGKPLAQYMANKAMFEVLENIFHDPTAKMFTKMD